MNRQITMTREEAVDELRELGIDGSDIYLIDIIPLIEMIWADGEAQESEIKILDNFLIEHVSRINDIAGYEILNIDAVRVFANRFLDEKPAPELLRTLRELIPAIRYTCSEEDMQLRNTILEACMDIAASSVVEYPYRWNERFDPAEKKCFFEILNSLDKKDPECNLEDD